MEDFRNDGYNVGRGRSWKNKGHDYPQADIDKYSYEQGVEEGERHRRASEELDREYF